MVGKCWTWKCELARKLGHSEEAVLYFVQNLYFFIVGKCRTWKCELGRKLGHSEKATSPEKERIERFGLK